MVTKYFCLRCNSDVLVKLRRYNRVEFAILRPPSWSSRWTHTPAQWEQVQQQLRCLTHFSHSIEAVGDIPKRGYAKMECRNWENKPKDGVKGSAHLKRMVSLTRGWQNLFLLYEIIPVPRSCWTHSWRSSVGEQKFCVQVKQKKQRTNEEALNHLSSYESSKMR